MTRRRPLSASASRAAQGVAAHSVAMVVALAFAAAAAGEVARADGARADREKGDRELGQYLSSECVTCHQISGRYDGIPPIVGWPEDSFVEILGLYRDRTRENPVMRSIAVKFTDEEIAALAAYFGSLKPKTD
jgi:cytochrome c553